MFGKKTRKESERRPPDFTTKLSETMGIAIWQNQNGDDHVKVGLARRNRDGSTFVSTTVPLSSYGSFVKAVGSVAAHYADLSSVPHQTRAELASIAEQLDDLRLGGPEMETIRYDDDSLNGAFPTLRD